MFWFKITVPQFPVWYKPWRTALTMHLLLICFFLHCQICRSDVAVAFCYSKQDSSLCNFFKSHFAHVYRRYRPYIVCVFMYMLISFHCSSFLVSRILLSKRLQAVLSTGSDSVLTATALPVRWFSSPPLRMFTSSYSTSPSLPPLHPLPRSHDLTMVHSAALVTWRGYVWFGPAITSDGNCCAGSLGHARWFFFVYCTLAYTYS